MTTRIIEASFRSFLDRLTYNDEYSTTDSNLCDSHVGARNERNIRQHFVICDQNSCSKGKRKCFDVFRLQECINDVCEDTLQVDKLYLLLRNSNANTAFGTQIGPPEEKT